MAATLRRELATDVEMIHGRYGEFAVLVDGDVVAASGVLSIIGVLPSASRVLEAVRARLSSASPARS